MTFHSTETTSTLLKQKVTARIRSFVTLCTEKYSSQKLNLKLYILDHPRLMTAIQDLCMQVDPRMLVMGGCDVSFLPKGDVGDKLHSGTGAMGRAYYATEYHAPSLHSARESPVLTSATMSGRSSYGDLAATTSSSSNSSSANHHHHGSGTDLIGGAVAGLGDLWNSFVTPAAGSAGVGSGAAAAAAASRKGSFDVSSYGVIPEGKSAYIVEGAFADSVKECVPVPVVIVQVNVHV
ncbi:hypothetical protein BDR26DRAFT_670363 [Obelidium mucronatum]|nr:hypothetical protein BDR26DRAFT_670363 [Obelidium mucronatum]